MLIGATPSMVYAQPVAGPSELLVGFGGLNERTPPARAPTFVIAGSWDWDKAWRAVFVLEGEITGFSEAAPCQERHPSHPESCGDAAVMAGVRLRPTPHASPGVHPFVTVLIGDYLKGSGVPEQDFVSSHLAVQLGGGAEFRWTNSIQGLRLSVDYRKVWAGNRDRNQLRFLGAYVVGPRRFTRRPTG